MTHRRGRRARRMRRPRALPLLPRNWAVPLLAGSLHRLRMGPRLRMLHRWPRLLLFLRTKCAYASAASRSAPALRGPWVLACPRVLRLLLPLASCAVVVAVRLFGWTLDGAARALRTTLALGPPRRRLQLWATATASWMRTSIAICPARSRALVRVMTPAVIVIVRRQWTWRARGLAPLCLAVG
jgi:hypothetical protein